MIMQSSIIDAKETILIFDKIEKTLYKKTAEALINDLKKIDAISEVDEEKNKRKKSIINEYLNFNSSLKILNGTIKTAGELNFKIQIIAQFY